MNVKHLLVGCCFFSTLLATAGAQTGTLDTDPECARNAAVIVARDVKLRSTDPIANSSADDPAAAQLVITTFDLRSNQLTLWGRNFDNGETPIVMFDGDLLALVAGYSADEIVVELDLPPDTFGDFLMTVTTGTTLKHFDAYGVTLGGAAWEDLGDQVLIRAMDLDVENETLTVTGQHFDNGNTPVVTLGDLTLPIKPGYTPSATEIVAVAPRSEDLFQIGEGILTVQTGSTVSKYDAFDIDSGEGDDSEYDCGLLCKIGPPDTTWTTGARHGEPEYFQLLNDYTINLPVYLIEKTKSQYPFGFRKWRDEIVDHSEDMPCVEESPGCEAVYYSTECGEWDYLSLSREGLLTIKAGYRWDGPSTWPVKAPNKLLHASLVHDALYDLMRLGALEPDPTGFAIRSFTIPSDDWKKTGWWNRTLADCMLYMIGVDDEYSWKWRQFALVRIGGSARLKNDIACWAYHAVASAGDDTTYDCAPPEGLEVTLDGGDSRFAMSWLWLEDGAFLGYGQQLTYEFAPGIHTVTLVVEDGDDDQNDYSSGDDYDLTKDFRDSDEIVITINVDVTPPVFDAVEDILAVNDPGECSAIVEFEVTVTDECGDPLVVCDPPSGSEFPVGATEVECVATDDSGNVASAGFVISVEDVEAPVITPMAEAMRLWPANHKYETITGADFLAFVTDNCTELTADDFEFVRVTSDEPEYTIGTGDGSTRNDIVMSIDRRSVDLRRERQGGGNGRVYTIEFTVPDEYGNEAAGAFLAHVPHSVNVPAIDDGPVYTVEVGAARATKRTGRALGQ